MSDKTNHRWAHASSVPETHCTLCNTKRQRREGLLTGQPHMAYFVNGRWTRERPSCVTAPVETAV